MNFGFLIFPGLEELDLVGPWEMVSLWSRVAQGPERCFMVAEKPEPVICAKGMSINPHVTFSECPSLDYLLVPGGEGTRKEVDNKNLVNFVCAGEKLSGGAIRLYRRLHPSSCRTALGPARHHPLGFAPTVT